MLSYVRTVAVACRWMGGTASHKIGYGLNASLGCKSPAPFLRGEEPWPGRDDPRRPMQLITMARPGDGKRVFAARTAYTDDEIREGLRQRGICPDRQGLEIYRHL